jgi:hypothetical protein
LVIGLRYIKRDKTDTEDYFVCSNDPFTGELVIEAHYGRRLEYIYPEYKGTHKHQLDKSITYGKEQIITLVNTISHTLFKK